MTCSASRRRAGDRRLVGEDQAAVGVPDDHRLGQVGQDRLEPLLEPGDQSPTARRCRAPARSARPAPRRSADRARCTRGPRCRRAQREHADRLAPAPAAGRRWPLRSPSVAQQLEVPLARGYRPEMVARSPEPAARCARWRATGHADLRVGRPGAGAAAPARARPGAGRPTARRAGGASSAGPDRVERPPGRRRPGTTRSSSRSTVSDSDRRPVGDLADRGQQLEPIALTRWRSRLDHGRWFRLLPCLSPSAPRSSRRSEQCTAFYGLERASGDGSRLPRSGAGERVDQCRNLVRAGDRRQHGGGDAALDELVARGPGSRRASRR